MGEDVKKERRQTVRNDEFLRKSRANGLNEAKKRLAEDGRSAILRECEMNRCAKAIAYTIWRCFFVDKRTRSCQLREERKTEDSGEKKAFVG